jgi:hypothetical protein
MNNSKTPKIVVGVGLAAVYAVGLTIVTMRNVPDSNVAQIAAVEAAAQLANEPETSMAIVSESGESPSLTEQTVAVTQPPPPVTNTTTGKPAAAARESVESDARSMEPTIATAPRVQPSDIEKPSPTGEVANVGNESALSMGTAPSSEEVEDESSGADDVATLDGEIEPAQ